MLCLVDIRRSDGFHRVLLNLGYHFHLGVGLFGQVLGALIHRGRLHHLDLVLTKLVHLLPVLVENDTGRGQEVRLVVLAAICVLHHQVHLLMLLLVEYLYIVELFFAGLVSVSRPSWDWLLLHWDL